MTLRSFPAAPVPGRGGTRAWVVLSMVCCVALVGCSSTPRGTSTSGETTELTARYGQSPAKDPSGFTYQPDVVVVDGGAAAVRSVSGDGLVWTIDGGVRGLGDLDVGEVMFLTSRAVGRVAAKERVGGDVAVTLVPVQPQEVIRDGRIKVDAAIDVADIGTDSIGIQEIPDLPGTVTTPDRADTDLRPVSMRDRGARRSTTVFATAGGAGVVREPGLRAGAPARRPAAVTVPQQPVGKIAGSDQKLPSPAKEKLDVTLNDWGVTTALDAKGLTVSVYRKEGSHLKFGADITLGFKTLRLATDVALTAGTIAANPGTVLHGLESLEVKLQAGLGGGTDSNSKVKLEVPAEIFNKPIMVNGLPMVLVGKVKLVIETALTGKNSTITASGKWGLVGALGMQSGTPLVPTFSVITSMMDSISGITLGPSGLVIAPEFKFSLGFGVPGASAGPYAKFRFAAGVTNGSAFGAPLARCTRVDLVIKGGFGMGINIDGELGKLIGDRLPGRPKFKADLESEFLWDIVKRSQTIPDVPLCTAGG
ncbi:hypothetical protein ABZ793_02665 [Micromonospora sp. NPDC047465]|uniref:hypothetical protein n=1 Tax=Micromonospora sp. NPDC047465 TaxID=3154813 RepID=UPI0033CD4B6F